MLRVDHLALLYMMFSCVFVPFPYGVLGQVWYLILSILIFDSYLMLNRNDKIWGLPSIL